MKMIGAYSAVSAIALENSKHTYVPALPQLGCIVNVCQECLAKVMNGQQALRVLGPVRVVTVAVDAGVLEARL